MDALPQSFWQESLETVSTNCIIFIFTFILFPCSCQVHISMADAILEYFLEVAVKDFVVGRVDQTQWHPDYCSNRVVLYVMVKK